MTNANTPRIRHASLNPKLFHFCGDFVCRLMSAAHRLGYIVSSPKTHQQQQFQFSTRGNNKCWKTREREIKLKISNTKPSEVKHERAWKDQNVMQRAGRSITNNKINVDMEKAGRLKGRNLPALASAAKNVMEKLLEVTWQQKSLIMIPNSGFSIFSARKVIRKMKSSTKGCFASWKWFRKNIFYTWCMITECRSLENLPTDVFLLISENADWIWSPKSSNNAKLQWTLKYPAENYIFKDYWPLALKKCTKDLHVKLKQKTKVSKKNWKVSQLKIEVFWIILRSIQHLHWLTN